MHLPWVSHNLTPGHLSNLTPQLGPHSLCFTSQDCMLLLECAKMSLARTWHFLFLNLKPCHDTHLVVFLFPFTSLLKCHPVNEVFTDPLQWSPSRNCDDFPTCRLPVPLQISLSFNMPSSVLVCILSLVPLCGFHESRGCFYHFIIALSPIPILQYAYNKYIEEWLNMRTKKLGCILL